MFFFKNNYLCRLKSMSAGTTRAWQVFSWGANIQCATELIYLNLRPLKHLLPMVCTSKQPTVLTLLFMTCLQTLMPTTTSRLSILNTNIGSLKIVIYISLLLLIMSKIRLARCRKYPLNMNLILLQCATTGRMLHWRAL
jgi:hypothetical protein